MLAIDSRRHGRPLSPAIRSRPARGNRERNHRLPPQGSELLRAERHPKGVRLRPARQAVLGAAADVVEALPWDDGRAGG
jgi:hypothetical protein